MEREFLFLIPGIFIFIVGIIAVLFSTAHHIEKKKHK